MSKSDCLFSVAARYMENVGVNISFIFNLERFFYKYD